MLFRRRAEEAPLAGGWGWLLLPDYPVGFQQLNHPAELSPHRLAELPPPQGFPDGLQHGRPPFVCGFRDLGFHRSVLFRSFSLSTFIIYSYFLSFSGEKQKNFIVVKHLGDLPLYLGNSFVSFFIEHLLGLMFEHNIRADTVK